MSGVKSRYGGGTPFTPGRWYKESRTQSRWGKHPKAGKGEDGVSQSRSRVVQEHPENGGTTKAGKVVSGGACYKTSKIRDYRKGRMKRQAPGKLRCQRLDQGPIGLCRV